MLLGQYPGWQQKVNYTIDVKMDTDLHQYAGEMQVRYFNNSPDDLDKVFLYAFFNAFQPGSMMDVRSRTIIDPDSRVGSRIYALPLEEQGWIKDVELSLNGIPCKVSIEETIIVVELPESIKAGTFGDFSMTWNAQVPRQIRRSGWMNKEGVEYSMTQWYPKFCEYDHEGWHSHPYVGREFHGIWGSYDVNIHLPSGYKIAATGIIKTPKEEAIESGDWHFTATNVIDFAWAADKKYVYDSIEVDENLTMNFVRIPNIIYDDQWAELPRFAVQGMRFLNDFIGRYPYPQYTVAQGGDGGMEYPMMTLVTADRSLPSLVGVTIHEMSHSWFQAVVATNESLYEWMDEGFTSWIESECMAAISPTEMTKPRAGGIHAYAYYGYIQQALSGNEEALSTHADHYTTNRAYGVAAYSKGEVLVEQLGAIIGDEVRNEGMREYFKVWSFKHPGPTDFKRIMEKTSGIELDWYFDYFVNTTHTIDYRISEVSHIKSKDILNVLLEKVGTMPMPQDLRITYNDGSTSNYHIPLVIMRGNRQLSDGEELGEDWPWTNPTYSMEIKTEGKRVVKIELDPNLLIADTNRENNLVEFKSRGKIEFTRE
ncbi:MAG: peptidase M1 [Bacteroidetes bacterium]|nr:MAG: peptidase M1 [Bacteroidota bacterium]